MADVGWLLFREIGADEFSVDGGEGDVVDLGTAQKLLVKVQGVAGGFAESGSEDLLLILHNAQRIRLRFIYGPDGDSVGFDARGFEEGAVGKKI